MLRDKPAPGKLRIRAVKRELCGGEADFVAVSGSVRECGTLRSASQNAGPGTRSTHTALALYDGWRENGSNAGNVS